MLSKLLHSFWIALKKKLDKEGKLTSSPPHLFYIHTVHPLEHKY